LSRSSDAAVRNAPIDVSPRGSDTITALTLAASRSGGVTVTACTS
jgi:hypothetical protein